MPNVVEILVTAKNLARPAMAEATADARGLGGVMGKMAAVGTASLIAIGAESVKMASNFESSTTRLVTSAGESNKNIGMVRKGMLDMASQVGDSAQELSKGMYTVESAGYHGADGLKVLKAAAEGAKDENADLGTVANAVTDALVDYHLKASDSADVTSKLVAAVSHGKTSFEEFSGSMSTVLPLASSLGVKLADVTGVAATMTAHGVSAAQATQNIANAMRHLANPTLVQKKAFEEFGITSKQVTESLSQKGLQGTMEMLSKTAEQAGKVGTPAYTQALAKLMGSAAGLNVALQTTGENSKQAQDAIRDIGKASADSKGDVEGFSEMQKTFKQRVAELDAGFQSLMITLGDKLIPVLSTVVGFFVKHQTTTEILVGVVIGLTAALTAYAVVMKTVELATKLWAAAQWALDAAMDANPIALVVLAIAGLVLGLVEAYKHVGWFHDAVKNTFDWIKDHWKLLLEILTGPIGVAVVFIIDHWKKIQHGLSEVVSFVKSHWRGIIEILTGPVGFAVVWVVDHWKKIVTVVSVVVSAVKNHWSEIKNILTAPFYFAWGVISGIMDKISSFISNLPNDVSNAVSSVGSFLGFAHGGVVGAAASGGPRNGLVMVGEQGPELVSLPSGSTVHSNPDTQRMLSSGGEDRPVVLEIRSGGSQLDNAVVEIIRKAVRIKGGNVQLALGQG